MKRKQTKQHKYIKRHIQQLLPISQCGLFHDQQSKQNVIFSMKNNQFGSKCILQPIARMNKKQIEDNESQWISQVSYFEQSKVYEPHKLFIHTKNDELENILETRFASLNQSMISLKSKVKLQSINPRVKSIRTTHLESCYLSKLNVLKRPDASMQSSTHMFEDIWSNFKHRNFEKSFCSLRSHKIEGIDVRHKKQEFNEKKKKQTTILSKVGTIEQSNKKKENQEIKSETNYLIPSFLLTVIQS